MAAEVCAVFACAAVILRACAPVLFACAAVFLRAHHLLPFVTCLPVCDAL